MTPTEYNEYVKFRWRPSDYGILAAAMGVGGEGGEVVDEAKKIAFHDGMLHNMADMSIERYENLVEEMGDTFYYLFALMNELNVTFDIVTQRNKRKLDQRFGADQPTSYPVQPPMTVEQTVG